jgi:hypothetical protein
LGHGFTVLPLPPTSEPKMHQGTPSSAVPAPLSICPTPFPKDLYDLAVRIQPAYNAVYANITRDVAFLDRVMGGVVSKVDEFQGELWRAWKACREDLVQVGLRERCLIKDLKSTLLCLAFATGTLPLGLPSPYFHNRSIELG